MPQVILHVPSSIGKESKTNLVAEIRKVITEVLEISENIGQVVLYETPIEYRRIHESRDANFVIVETMMYPVRTPELKARLMESFVSLVNKYTGVDEKDINCLIHEIPPENYFGGTTHKYIEDLNSKRNEVS